MLVHCRSCDTQIPVPKIVARLEVFCPSCDALHGEPPTLQARAAGGQDPVPLVWPPEEVEVGPGGEVVRMSGATALHTLAARVAAVFVAFALLPFLVAPDQASVLGVSVWLGLAGLAAAVWYHGQVADWVIRREGDRLVTSRELPGAAALPPPVEVASIRDVSVRREVRTHISRQGQSHSWIEYHLQVVPEGGDPVTLLTLRDASQALRMEARLRAGAGLPPATARVELRALPEGGGAAA